MLRLSKHGGEWELINSIVSWSKSVDNVGNVNQLAVAANVSISKLLHGYFTWTHITLTLWSLEQVAILRPWKSYETSWIRSLWSAAILRATNMITITIPATLATLVT